MFSKHEYSMKRPGNNAHLIEGEPHSGSTNKGTNSAAVYVSSPWTGEASVAPPSFVAAILRHKTAIVVRPAKNLPLIKLSR